MQTYFDHPEYFKNSNTFTKNVCPGFYFKTTDGLGMMAEIETTRLSVFYRIVKQDEDDGLHDFYNVYSLFYGTQEVLQTTHIVNDKEVIKQLADERHQPVSIQRWSCLLTTSNSIMRMIPLHQPRLLSTR